MPTTTSININLTADADGPFFISQDACEAAGNDSDELSNVLRFRVTNPVQSDPYDGSSDRCVARVLVPGQSDPYYDRENNTDMGRRKRQSEGIYVDTYYAISQWGNNEIFVYNGEFPANATSASEDRLLCLEYRCSTPESPTNVTLQYTRPWADTCIAEFTAPVLTSGGQTGFFLNNGSDVTAALEECESSDSTDYTMEAECAYNYVDGYV